MPTLFCCQLKCIYMFFKVFIDFGITICIGYVSSTLLFLERALPLVEVNLDFLTLAINYCNTAEYIVALLG